MGPDNGTDGLGRIRGKERIVKDQTVGPGMLNPQITLSMEKIEGLGQHRVVLFAVVRSARDPTYLKSSNLCSISWCPK